VQREQNAILVCQRALSDESRLAFPLSNRRTLATERERDVKRVALKERQSSSLPEERNRARKWTRQQFYDQAALVEHGLREWWQSAAEASSASKT